MSFIKYNPEYDLSHNADDVNFRMQHLRMADLLSMVESGKLDLFEDDVELRNSLDSWSLKQKSLFIESLMIKIPVPLFYVDGSQPTWKVVDGIKRLIAVTDFVYGKYALKELEYLKRECEKCTFKELNGYLSSRILDAEVMVYIINPGTPKEVRYNIYQRLNQDRRGINWDKIQNVFFRELSSGIIRYLSEHPYYAEASQYQVQTRFSGRSQIIRFIAFSLLGYENYPGNIDLFTSDALLRLNHRDEQLLEQIQYKFAQSMERICLLFIHESNPSYFQKVFDAISWNLSEISEVEFKQLMNNREQFLSSFQDFLISKEMNYLKIYPSLNYHTKYVKLRFSKIRQIIEQYIY